MFSEALRILDNNTAELMADRFKAQLENAKIEVKAVKHELKTTRKEVTCWPRMQLTSSESLALDSTGLNIILKNGSYKSGNVFRSY